MKRNFFAPNRIVFEHTAPPEGVSGGPDKPKEAAADTEAASREAVIVYNSNYRSLTDRIQQYSDSKNPRIREIAQKYMQRLSMEAIDPQTAAVLKRNALQNNIRLISSIITDFSKEVRKATIEGSQRTKEDTGRGEESTAPESKKNGEKEPEETLEHAYKRYELIFNSSVSTIQTWINDIAKKDNPVTENKDETLSKLGLFADQLKARFGGRTTDMFKNPAEVDRVISSINDYMSKNVDPYYNGLMNRHREIMAQRNKEKQNKTV
jgi:hypothetical protein